MKSRRPNLVIVSNRIPISFVSDNGKLKATPSSGGLVTALEPVVRDLGGTWVGSADVDDSPQVRKLLTQAAKGSSFKYTPIFLSKDEKTNFYEGFSNEVIWPLFHDLQSRCNFDPVYWKYYQQVNEKFAAATHKAAKAGDLIWIHDYQLMQVAKTLRPKLPDTKLGFFMHIPFPSPDIFEKLPWRREILDGLLEHDLIGLQTARDQRNLIACIRTFLPGVEIMKDRHRRIIKLGKRRVRVGFFPISVDFKGFSKDAAVAPVRDKLAELRGELGNMQIAMGVDRLDYTKGIPERLRAFAAFLRRYPQYQGKVSLVQVVVPSRESIPGYQNLKADIERLVTRVNGEFSHPSWIPINYMHRSISRDELLTLYRLAVVALITPLKDGMNLVAKEYCAANVDEDGTLILSEFAGAAPELGTAAILVNPYDEVGVADALNSAFSMTSAERKKGMRRIRQHLKHFDVHHWREEFFEALEH